MTVRVVYDCMIYLQAVTNAEGAAGRCVSSAWDGKVDLIVSRTTMDEVEDVLTRPKTRRKFRSLTPSRVDIFLARVKAVATLIDPVPAVVTLRRDTNDEKYLNLAVASNAAVIVSRDNDLLDLMTATDPDAAAFRAAYPGIAILDPPTFLATLPPDPPAV